jgi:hypothetical protein
MMVLSLLQGHSGVGLLLLVVVAYDGWWGGGGGGDLLRA